MPNYQDSKIYRIVCNTTGLTYIGSTTYPTIARRMAIHKHDYKRFSKDNTIMKCSSVRVLESNNYEIILIENFPCNNKDELHKRERYWIENIECVNLHIPSRTHKESNAKYYAENAEREKERSKKYYAYKKHLKQQSVKTETDTQS